MPESFDVQVAERLAALERKARRNDVLAISHVRANTAVAQNIGDSSWVTVQYDTEVYDVLGEYDAGTYTFTATFPGYYLVQAAIIFSATTDWGATEYAQLSVYINGVVSSIIAFKTDFSGANIFVFLSGSATVKLAAGDTVTVRVYQTSGATRALYNSANYNWLTVDRLI